MLLSHAPFKQPLHCSCGCYLGIGPRTQLLKMSSRLISDKSPPAAHDSSDVAHAFSRRCYPPPERNHWCFPIRATGASLPCGRHLLAPYLEIKEKMGLWYSELGLHLLGCRPMSFIHRSTIQLCATLLCLLSTFNVGFFHPFLSYPSLDTQRHPMHLVLFSLFSILPLRNYFVKVQACIQTCAFTASQK